MAPKVEPRDARRLGEVGLTGWRRPVADAASRPLTKVTPMSRDELRGWVGLAFVAMSAWYLGSTMARFLRTR
jgi:hypothetical protein